jgi:RNA polymerase sigma-70 factor (ECF subfamily)
MLVRPTSVNGQPGIRVLDQGGGLLCVLEMHIADGRVQALRNVLNPDKLRHLGPVGDLGQLFAAERR